MNGHDLNLLALGGGIGVYLAFAAALINGLLADHRQARREAAAVPVQNTPTTGRTPDVRT